jgi:hypothetical protein
MRVNADLCHQGELINEHMAQAARGAGERPIIFWYLLVHDGCYSFTSTTSGVCHARCCPPSSAMV